MRVRARVLRRRSQERRSNKWLRRLKPRRAVPAVVESRRTWPRATLTLSQTSTTPSCPSRIHPVLLSLGPLPDRLVSRDPVSPLHSQRRWQQSLQHARRWSTAGRRLTYSLRAQGRAAKPQSAHYRPPAWQWRPSLTSLLSDTTAADHRSVVTFKDRKRNQTMARDTGPATRVSRRLRVDLVGGDMALERRPYPPGQPGRNRIKESEYLLQLQEKQKAKYTYGVLERQFRRYYVEAN